MKPRLRGWIIRIGLGLAVALLLLLVAGTGWQAVAHSAELSAYPAPGRLIDIGGYALHLQCLGQGSPTVILEGGAPEWSIHWQTVHREIAKFTRVCAYDRAGYGWSDPGPSPRTAQRIVDELHTLLVRAGENAPFVLAAHSLWGPAALLYQHTYPEDKAECCDAAFWATMQAEYSAMPESAAQLKGLGLPGSLGDLPLVVIKAGVRPIDDYPPDAIWNETQAQLAKLSTRGDLVVAEDSGHFVQLEQPSVVLDAVRWVVDLSRP